MRIDLHTHSRVSDGTDSPTMLVMNAHQAGLDMVALTDHDTMDGIPEAVTAGQRIGVSVVPGIEVSTKYETKTIHLLGYGVVLAGSQLVQELQRVRESRVNRAEAMIKKLAELGYPLDPEIIAKTAALTVSVGRPHIADAMVKMGYVADRSAAFEDFLSPGKPAYVSRYSIPLGRAIDLVHQAGGAAVLAHPGIRGADEVLTGEVIAKLASEHQLDGIEVDYPLHDADTRDILHRIGARLGLIRTGSSDYHGTGKVGHELGTATTRQSAWESLNRRIAHYGGVGPR